MQKREFSRHGYIWTPTRRDLLKTAGGVLTAGLLAPRVARAATFTLLQHVSATAASPTPSIDSTGADLLVWCHTRRGDASYVELPGTDSKGNLASAYTKLGPYNNGGDNATVVIYVLQGGTFGAGHTIPYGGGAGSGSDFVSVWSGSAASAIDQSAGFASAGNVSSIQPGSITPTLTNELVIALLSDQAYPNDRTHSVDGSMTELDNQPSPDFYYRGMVAYKIQTAAAAINPTFTATGTAKNLSAMIVSFKSTSSSAGAAPKVRHRVLGGQ
jgi:hypothetical protein